MHAFRRFFGHTHTRTELHTYTRCAVHFIHCYLQFKETRGLYLTAALRFDVDYSWILSTLTQTCLSVPQFGSCSSFGTFRPAFSHTGTIRPLSVILPASPTFNHSPGSNTPSPTSKIPSWKVCFRLQFYFWVSSFFFFFKLCCFFASCVLLPSCTLMSLTSQSPFCCCSSSSVFPIFPHKDVLN